MSQFKCVCGSDLGYPQGDHDVKCTHCGRVYNPRGQYLWREADPEAPLGSGDFVTGEEAHGDRRATDQDTAIEEAFVAGILPEEDRRDDGESDESRPDAGDGGSAPAVPAAKSHGGRKKAR